ncbi:hypothetical protein GCM10027277_38490 [Pseudoduganella ginsengisoli]
MTKRICVIVTAVACGPALAFAAEGTLGWRYIDWYKSGSTIRYARDPVTACSNSSLPGAFWGLISMEPLVTSSGWDGGAYFCNLIGHTKPPSGAALVILDCDAMAGYIPQFPGVCKKKRQAPPAAPGCSANSAGFTIGNPIMLAAGAKIQNEVELQSGKSLQVSRLYRTERAPSHTSTAGYIWSFSFQRYLLAAPVPAGQVSPFVTLFNSDGTSVQFNKAGNQYVPADSHGDVLTPLPTGPDEWLLKTAEGRLDKFTKVSGHLRLTASTTAAGQTSTYLYDSNGRLTDISDTAGRTLKVTWHDNYTIAAIASPELEVRYNYEQLGAASGVTTPGAARLVSVSKYTPDGKVISTRQYHYGEDWDTWFLLTGITDENNVRYTSYAYDNEGRAVRSEHAGGADRYDISYPSDSSRVVTDPLGAQRTITLSWVGAHHLVTKFSQPGGAGCGPAAANYAYNDNGTLLSRTDFNGTKTCYSYASARKLETTRVEGLQATASCPAPGAIPSVGQRKTSTKWHPDWAIPVATATPLKLTHYIYNGQPDLDGKILDCASGATLPNGLPFAVLCKKIEIPTSDANGSAGFNATPAGPARATTYTYNADGQVLTETAMGRAGSSGDTTTYAYYTATGASYFAGDLAKVTLPDGSTTEYLEYTASGMPTRIREANSQTTLQVFSPQGWLLQRTIFAGTPDEQQTRYSYDPAGQLIRVEFPDTTAVSYTYDDAHRLTGISDNSGNTVRYVLDPAGNRISEEVRNANGILRHQITRVFDVLGRLQQTSEGGQR